MWATRAHLRFLRSCRMSVCLQMTRQMLTWNSLLESSLQTSSQVRGVQVSWISMKWGLMQWGMASQCTGFQNFACLAVLLRWYFNPKSKFINSPPAQLQLMGIIRLGLFLKEKFPHLWRKTSPLEYRNRVLAVDASGTMYSFLAKTITFTRNVVNAPTDAHGNQTGHLIGLLYRALLCKEMKISTVWVFDGRPPQSKFDELYRRKQLKEEAILKTESAMEEGDIEEAVRKSKQSIYISSQQRQDAKTLLRLMGLPVFQAQSEAQAQCAELAKQKLVQGVIGQDTDTLVFGAPFILKNFNRGNQVISVQIQAILKELGLTFDQFLDFCILCGCDYTAKIPRIGPVKALSYIKQKGNIESVIQMLSNDPKLRKSHPIPDDFNYLIARKLFRSPKLAPIVPEELIPGKIQQEELRAFLRDRDFDEKRVENWLKKMKEFDEKIFQ